MMEIIQGKAKYSVQGQVRDENGRPMWGHVVKAFDVDIRSETLLGETTTDSRGSFLIEYCSGAQGCSEVGAPDILVRVYAPGEEYPDTNPEDLELRVWSEIYFNVSGDVTINLTLAEEETFDGECEYEVVKARIAPSIEDVEPAELLEADVSFLAGDTEEDIDKVAAYRHAHILANEAVTV